MSEHRPVLDPSILGRLTSSIAPIQAAWESDVQRLHVAEDRLLFTERQLQLANERVEGLRADISHLRDENRDLIKRNAHIEAQLERIFDGTVDAEESLRVLRERAVGAARTVVPAGDQQWKDPEKRPASGSDGTGLTADPPLIFQRPEHGPSADRLPMNEFGRHEAGGAVG